VRDTYISHNPVDPEILSTPSSGSKNEYQQPHNKIIGFAFKIHNSLGAGFLESVYENALVIELHKIGIEVMQQEELDVWYEGHRIGHFIPDLWIPNTLIVEVKAVRTLSTAHELQLVNYWPRLKFRMAC
jgi:GxxExxY protein